MKTFDPKLIATVLKGKIITRRYIENVRVGRDPFTLKWRTDQQPVERQWEVVGIKVNVRDGPPWTWSLKLARIERVGYLRTPHTKWQPVSQKELQDICGWGVTILDIPALYNLTGSKIEWKGTQ